MEFLDGEHERRQAAAKDIRSKLAAVDEQVDPANMSPDHIDDRYKKLLADVGLGNPLPPVPSAASLEEILEQ